MRPKERMLMAKLEIRSLGSLINDPVIAHVRNPNESCQLRNRLCRPLGNNIGQESMSQMNRSL